MSKHQTHNTNQHLLILDLLFIFQREPALNCQKTCISTKVLFVKTTSAKDIWSKEKMEPRIGFEPTTYALRMRCSTSWAISAHSQYWSASWPIRGSLATFEFINFTINHCKAGVTILSDCENLAVWIRVRKEERIVINDLDGLQADLLQICSFP